jgi:membrane protein implicated in regulation of membrane protease activity
MARKIKKGRTSLSLLLFLLLIPWVVMGGVAAAAFSAGLPDYAAILIALAAALAVTFYIRGYMQRRRKTRSQQRD